MESPEVIDKFKDSLHKLLAEYASEGLQISTMRSILSDVTDNLELPKYCEKWLETFTYIEENITGEI